MSLKYYDDSLLTVLLATDKETWEAYRKHILLNSISCYHIPYEVRKIFAVHVKKDYGVDVIVYKDSDDRFTKDEGE